MRTDYELLTLLDAFIRRYYKDRLIRGGLYAVGLLAGAFLVVALLSTSDASTAWPAPYCSGASRRCGNGVGALRRRSLVKLFRLGP